MKTLQDRFDEKWIGEPNSGCWLWTAAVCPGGYGCIGFEDNGSWKKRDAHRASWELHRGTIPNGMQILHRCDVRCCVNPDHLFLGTQADNIKDAVAKGRMPSKLTPKDVRFIRSSSDSNAKLGKKFSVDRSTISRVRSGEDHASVW